MKRGIKRSLVRPAKTNPFDDSASIEDERAEGATSTLKKGSSGAGSAWKAGAVAQAQAGLDEAREKLAADILAGSHVIEIDPTMLSDPIGSDRRDDWMEQEDFRSFVASIRDNGQDQPVLVWPEDPGWHPDSIDPDNLERVQFLLLAGRRRREAARILGRPVRAVLASQVGRDSAEATFNMLVMRFRENDEREDLSAFERLLSIGQMYDELAAASDVKLKAKVFAERIGVHESVVSRARAVFTAKSEILNAFKNVYDMSFSELQNALATLTNTREIKTKRPTPRKISVKRKVGARNLLVSSQSGKLSVSASGMNLDKEALEGLSDVIATYLQEHGSKK
jgi:ParB family chromosome partitioning protein